MYERTHQKNRRKSFLKGRVPVSGIDRELSEIRERLAVLESRVGFLLKGMGLEPEEIKHQKVSPAIMSMLASGDKIGAIKAYRSQTGAGLKDAKVFIESLLT